MNVLNEMGFNIPVKEIEGEDFLKPHRNVPGPGS